MNRKRGVILLIFLVLLLLAVNYRFLDTKVIEFLEESDTGIVERVIDGDTLEINDTSIRLLGINTPERGEKYYQEAKDFLEMVALNKTVTLKYGKEKYDKYNRVLAYVFIGNANVNKEIVDEGYANYYFPSGKDIYYESFVKAWEHCLNNNKCLCEKSDNPCSPCIEINSTHITNACSFQCNINNWTIKGEGRKKFVFNTTLTPNQSIKFNLTLSSYGDTLFLRDEEGKLVLWKNY